MKLLLCCFVKDTVLHKAVQKTVLPYVFNLERIPEIAARPTDDRRWWNLDIVLDQLFPSMQRFVRPATPKRNNILCLEVLSLILINCNNLSDFRHTKAIQRTTDFWGQRIPHVSPTVYQNIVFIIQFGPCKDRLLRDRVSISGTGKRLFSSTK